VCAAFCADCRYTLDRGDWVYWWRVLPFHQPCGPLPEGEDAVFVQWLPPYECLVRLCAEANWLKRQRAESGGL